MKLKPGTKVVSKARFNVGGSSNRVEKGEKGIVARSSNPGCVIVDFNDTRAYFWYGLDKTFLAPVKRKAKIYRRKHV